MSCPICGARTNGPCKRCRMEQRLEREDRERREAEPASEKDDEQ